MTTAIVVDEAAKPKADAARLEAETLLDMVRSSSITSDEDEAAAVETIREVKRHVERTKELKKFFCDPLKRVLRTYDDFFNEPVKIWLQVEADLKQKIAAYSRDKQAANQRALAQAAQAQTAEQARAIVAQVTSTEGPKGTSIRYRWVFEVVDADAVPRHLCSPDPKKIGAALAVGQDGQPEPISGVRWKQEPIVTVRKT